MTDALSVLPAAAAGVLLGALFFAGLWWTLQKGTASPRPGLWFLGSFVVRSALVLSGFYLVGGGRWQSLLACLLGFLIARLVVIRLVRSAAEPRHAP